MCLWLVIEIEIIINYNPLKGFCKWKRVTEEHNQRISSLPCTRSLNLLPNQTSSLSIRIVSRICCWNARITSRKKYQMLILFTFGLRATRIRCLTSGKECWSQMPANNRSKKMTNGWYQYLRSWNLKVVRLREFLRQILLLRIRNGVSINQS